MNSDKLFADKSKGNLIFQRNYQDLNEREEE